MGLEATVTAHYEGNAIPGKALLEPHELVFRGSSVRVRLPIGPETRVRVAGGRLHVRAGGDEIALDLGGDAAAKWAARITNPKSRIEKLDVREGGAVVLKMRDAPLSDELKRVGARVTRTPKPGGADVVFWRVSDRPALDELRTVAPLIKPSGAIWVVYPKGTDTVTQADVMAAAKRHGLVFTKIVAFSGAESALKLVIPRDKR